MRLLSAGNTPHTRHAPREVGDARLRSRNLVITVDYSGWDIPGGAPAREFESATVEVAADVARQATR
jgi:hypothetical protein